ncbi:VPA1262 family N-terminal domain-containing protein [Pectobacterium sp. CHL-2024]|uniref:VPA1262 family N-terminal domain-containing protein n=1 Tax=Pectobacterium sp. CHL-2024 TaxID=3377079 RepID=UPI0037F80E3A
MPIALSIFGVAPLQGAATFCYAQLRSQKTTRRYLPPNLPKTSLCKELARIHSDKFSFELQVWHIVLEDQESAQTEADLVQGIFRIPDNCPIQSGQQLSGQVFTDTYLLEQSRSVAVDGGGALLTRGFVINDGAKSIVSTLQQITGKNEVSGELNDLCILIARESGLQSLAEENQKLGVVEHLRRKLPDTGEPPIRVTLTKPNVGSQDPCREIILTRSSTAPAAALRISLVTKSWEAITKQQLVDISSDCQEIKVDAGAHVTSLSIRVFENDTGELIDQQELRYIQHFAGSIIAQNKTDELQPPLRTALVDGDLTSRPRFNVTPFSLDDPGRAGGFDKLRANTKLVESFVGARNWKAENRFFPASQESQLDVIRWIKQCIEKPEITEVFLVDPYLGNDALERVLIRQGNESVKMTILVSPGNIDPDAEALDTSSTPGHHVQNLVKKASSLADKLCGEIEIFHVKRGNDKRQAFHDRHLGLIDRNGIPRVFLLSNSLSKAAGDWPFTVAEVDTLTSRQITLYVEDLLAGKEENGKQIEATSVWKSSQTSVNQHSANTPQIDTLSAEFSDIYLALFNLNTQGQITNRSMTDPVVEKLILALPTSFDNQKLAESIVQSMHGRDHLLPAIIQRFSEYPDISDIAVIIEDKFIHRLLARLTIGSDMFGFAEPLTVLLFAGNIISRKQKGTDFLRNNLNPILDSYARTLETSSVQDNTIRILIAGLGLTVIGLELARVGEDIDVKFRNGIAIDYINQLGRLLSSFTSQTAFGQQTRSIPGEYIALESLKIGHELAESLEHNVRNAMNLLLQDTRIPSRFTS